MSVVTSPASRSTTDIWPAIFASALPDELAPTTCDIVPFRLVSHSWNNLAINTPALWNFIDISIIKGTLSPPLSILELRLSRTKSFPLIIRVHGMDSDSWPPQIATRLMRLLNQHAFHWHKVTITIPGKEMRAIEECTGYAPVLRSLTVTISSHNPQCEPATRGIIRIATNAPLLKQFLVLGASDHVLTDVLNCAVAWSSFTHIILDRLHSIQVLLELLDRCTSLERGTFGLADHASTFIEPGTAIVRSSLSGVTLVLRENELGILLNHTRFPALQHLAIHAPVFPLPRPAPDVGFPVDDTWPHSALLSCFEGSNCSLETLEIQDMGITGIQFAELLQHAAGQHLKTCKVNNVANWSHPGSVSVEYLRERTRAQILVEVDLK